MSGKIFGYDDYDGDQELRCDVCIVGSGAGGSVLAAGLAEKGLDVIVLEAGQHYTKDDFTLQEADALPAMYQERGSRASSDVAITILQGRTVGGTTTINWTTCYRTPMTVRHHWEEAHGIEDLDLDPHFDAVEARLNIGEWPREIANANNKVLFDGCEALGWEAKPMRRNVKGCANSGYCGLGCPVDGKQAMAITYLADAVAAGARVFSNVEVDRFETDGKRVTGIVGQAIRPEHGAPQGPKVRVRCRVAVSAGGAINGPALLLRSGIDVRGLVGRRTFIHPVVATFAVFPEPIQPFYGAPQSAGSHHFIDGGPGKMGFFMEAAPLQPVLTSVGMPVFGDKLMEAMARLPHTNALLALGHDGMLPGDRGGTVGLKPDGRPTLDYPLTELHEDYFRRAFKALAQIQLAAGAEFVGTGHRNTPLFKHPDELSRLDSLPYGAHQHPVFTAHQMGGCAMGSSAHDSVVDTSHKVRGYDNLFVVDGSVLPTALGVNPSETIYALSHRARRFVGEAI